MAKNAIEGLNLATKALRETIEQNQKKYDALLTEKTNRIENDMADLAEKVDALALQAGRPAATSEKNDASVEIFTKAMRFGPDSLSAVEQKTLSVGVNADGGFAVPEVMHNQIVEKLFESNPLRALAGVYSTSGKDLEFLIENSEVGAGWVGEVDARDETATAKLDSVVIPVHEMYAEPRATRQLLEDNAFGLEAWLTAQVSAKFGRMEASAFMNGTGAGAPKGILAYEGTTLAHNVVKAIETSVSGNIAGDDIYSVIYDLDAGYLAGASWLVNRATLAAISKLKDANGNYLWQPALVAGQPSTLAGYAVHQGEDLEALAAGNSVALFGDFSKAYAIVDRPGSMVMIRDEITDKRFVKFYTRTRVGGGLIRGEALRIVKVKA